ncbi:hypothetical protein BV22DRAFT_1024674 [Leucogyrophana mollusca]|uniref:Uncharacterized protein n=1 Tax=Leucogyrophana mollusca TaxID=85980 RepID=A0ACB8AYN1_9AGAM|nr:hypothetical protein BV22DRAFT_1024674 [Leucogyrophana mollusca]
MHRFSVSSNTLISQDNPLLLWLPERQKFLEELIRLEGRGVQGIDELCSSCKNASSRYRCEDCFGVDMHCIDCVVQKHAHSPLHRIEEWTGEYFEHTSLKKLGLRIQLGHNVGDRCMNATTAFGDEFVVIDSHGIHEVGLDYCGCETAEARTTQLLRMAWFPSTTIDPKTAATFRLLEEYHLLSFESKVSPYEFYHALARRTDNTGLKPLKDRYEAFMRMIREWRHLKMVKRSGRGHEPGGVEDTKEGELAVTCPACPHPGKNLPDGWQSVSSSRRWIYGLFVAIDANFRLKRKAVSKDSVDPGLSRGWAYFVEELAYKTHLLERIDELQEKSTCSSHSAVDMADTKSSRGLAATGVGTIDCARHNMKLPAGVGDLQKGEKYVNMDYLFFSALKHSSVTVLNVSYDIACQWHKKLWHRMTWLAPSNQLDYTAKLITFFVPKFHLPAHVVPCHTKFSFNFIRGVGRTDGEAPERGWANINPVASSTKEMGPGNRRDTLDDHFGDWNWKKVVGLGATVLRKIQEAIPERNSHLENLRLLEESIESSRITASLAGGSTDEPVSILTSWRKEAEAWESDPTQPNPFEKRVETMTQATVRLQLAQDDAQKLANESSAPLHEEVTPSVLISAGLDVEEQQATIQNRRNALTRKIDAWAKIQALYIPGVVALRVGSNGTSGTEEEIEKAENQKLWLPSQLPRGVVCDQELRSIEWRLRYAQAGDALNELRQSLRLSSYLNRFKDRFLRGQGANTRARNTLKTVDAKSTACKARYRAAHAALHSLSPILNMVGWQNTFRALTDDDVKPMVDLLEAGTEGRRQLTWIWTMRGAADNSDEGLQDALRIEWCKARARAARWSEEVELLFEEKRRILQFFNWQAEQWVDRAQKVFPGDAIMKEGLIAYALRQAALRRSLAAHFTHLWRDTQRLLDIANEGMDTDDSQGST